MRSKLFFILALLMFLSLPSVRAHAETTVPDRVDSAEALSQWLDSHKESGGQVALDADIEWEGYFKFLTKAPVIIDAGSYSFHLNYRSYLGFSGPVTIKGSPLPDGVLFDGEQNAQLSLDDGARVVAEGDNVTAVQTRWSQGLSTCFADICVTGRQATAVRLAGGDLSLSCIRLYASGEGAACLDAGEGTADVFFSILKATGPDAVSLRSGAGSVVDTAACSPEPEDAVLIPASRHKIGLWVANSDSFFYKSIQDTEPLPGRVEITFDKTESTPARSLSLDWTPETTPPAVPGSYTVTGVLELPEDFTALLGDFKPTLSVQMVDPSRPYLKPIYQLNADGVCAIPYFKTFNSKDHHEILYLSEDNGKSWHSVPSDSGKGDRYMSYNHLSIQFKNYFEPGKTYLLKMEVESPEISGTSNILEITLSDDGSLDIFSFDGDRDFSDRDDSHSDVIPVSPDTPIDTAAADGETYSSSEVMDMVEANPGYTTFFGEGIQASVDSQALAALMPGADDTLTVQLTALGGSRYRVAFIKKSGEAVTFSDTPLLVRINIALRENETPDQLSFKTEDGAAADIAAYNSETGQLELRVSVPGVYTLSSDWSVPAAPAAALQAPAPGPIWIGLAVLTAICTAALIIARLKKRTV